MYETFTLYKRYRLAGCKIQINSDTAAVVLDTYEQVPSQHNEVDKTTFPQIQTVLFGQGVRYKRVQWIC